MNGRLQLIGIDAATVMAQANADIRKFVGHDMFEVYLQTAEAETVNMSDMFKVQKVVTYWHVDTHWRTL